MELFIQVLLKQLEERLLLLVGTSTTHLQPMELLLLAKHCQLTFLQLQVVEAVEPLDGTYHLAIPVVVAVQVVI
jgi:hypothetical protein